MHLYCIRIFVDDWDAAVAFYRDILELPLGFCSPEYGWAEFDAGGAKIAVEHSEPEDGEADLVGRFVGVSLQVGDIRATYKRLLSRGVTFTAPPEHMPWGGVLAHFRDPAGNILTLLGSADMDVS